MKGKILWHASQRPWGVIARIGTRLLIFCSVGKIIHKHLFVFSRWIGKQRQWFRTYFRVTKAVICVFTTQKYNYTFDWRSWIKIYLELKEKLSDMFSSRENLCRNGPSKKRLDGERGVRSAEYGKWGVWKMRSMENEEYGKWGVWKMRSMENAEYSVWKCIYST